MLSHRLRWSGAVLLGLLLLSALAVGQRDATAAYHVDRDFSAPLSYSQAQAVVQAAQASEVQLREQALGMRGVSADQLPFTPVVYFSQTGHHLSNRAGFLDYWRANGQLVSFGYPITEELIEDGKIVQYFERARFEFDPTAGIVLGLVGSEAAAIREVDRSPSAERAPAGRLFPETGHQVWGEFLRFWEERGGLARFGYPLSSEFERDGRVVQYFERARFEYHPEALSPFHRNQGAALGLNLNALFEVSLGDVGRTVAEARGLPVAPVTRLEGAAEWNPALWQRHIEVDLSRQWLTAYEGGLVVYRAPVATGRDGFNTPPGNYAIYSRTPLQTMVGDMGGESWNVPNVPWVQYVVGGVALHGTYWHNAHGTGARMSHGCINLRIDDAEWLYRWADIGTTVRIHH